MKLYLTIMCLPKDELVILEWEAGEVRVLKCDERLRPDVDRWIKQGIEDWVPREGTPMKTYRHTEASNKEFLIRLSEYVRKQTAFHSHLHVVAK